MFLVVRLSSPKTGLKGVNPGVNFCYRVSTIKALGKLARIVEERRYG